MLLTELTESLAAFLNTDTSAWTDENILASAELDPAKCMLPSLGVYVVPTFVQYDVDSTNARMRGPLTSHPETMYVTVIVSKVFLDLPTGDGVANWDEAKVIVDTRQFVERFILDYSNTEITLVSVESNPLEEIELDNRNFISVTTFGFRQLVCASQ